MFSLIQKIQKYLNYPSVAEDDQDDQHTRGRTDNKFIILWSVINGCHPP